MSTESNLRTINQLGDEFTTLYFAYGSNMLASQMEERCPSAVPLGVVTLDDYAFIISGAGVASVEPRGGSVTQGVLWAITEACERTLDRKEGVKAGCYRRVFLPVTTADGESKESLVYIDTRIGSAAARGGYMEKIVRGAIEFELDPEYIRDLTEWDPETKGLLPEA